MWVRYYSLTILIFLTNIFTASCQEKGSLTYVIDDTFSMRDDIRQVKYSTDEITKIVLEEKASQIKNMVLVTVNDPAVKVWIDTENRNSFKSEINRISVYGGGDCPEPSMEGILLGLQKSRPGSFIYVFTDASAKDYGKADEIKNLCQKKQTQITFVLTGYCYRLDEAGFKVYYDIATACSGIAFFVSKQEVDQVLNTIKETITGNKTTLTAIKAPPYKYTDIPFMIDDQTEYAIVTASGSAVSLSIRGPQAEQQRILWVNNAKVIKLNRPTPGQYVATVKGNTETSVYIVGRTDFLFSHGFSELEPKSIKDTTPQPIKDAPTHISIAATDPKHTVNIISAQILDMNENIIRVLPLKRISNDFYTTPAFAAPSHRFKVAVIGKAVRDGQDIRRIAKIPVTPQEPPKILPNSKKPVLTISEGKTTQVAYGTTVKLTCKVSAYPEPKITWRDSRGTTLISQNSVVELPYDYISYLTIADPVIRDTFTCHAANNQGSADQKIDVIVKEPFDVKSSIKGQTEIQYGAKGILKCEITASMPMHIYWTFKKNKKGKIKKLATSNKYDISADGKVLNIKKMDLDMVGKYSCKASLDEDPSKFVKFSTRVKVGGLIAPKITTKEKIYKALVGDVVLRIPCDTVGEPKPVITWKTAGTKIKPDSRYSIVDGALLIKDLKESDSKSYVCVAKNALGSTQVTFKAEVNSVPIVSGMSTQATTKGLNATIFCQVSGLPQPAISWQFKAKDASEFVSIPGSDNKLHISNANEKHTGQYKCVAQNVLGRAEHVTSFIVKFAPEITTKEKIYKARVGDVALRIPCDTVGEPKPVIIWKAAGTEIKPNSHYSIVDGALLIKDPKESDSKSYVCEAQNALGSTQATFKAEVHSVPVVTGMSTQSTTKGLNATIFCQVSGLPQPAISWQFKAKDASEFVSIPGSDNKLHISNANEKHTGQYKCVAQNVLGRAEHVTSFIVKFAPEITTKEQIYKARVGDVALRIPCDTVGEPKPVITWKAAGTEIKPNSHYSIVGGALLIKDPKESDSISYVCEAKNALGSTQVTFKAEVYSVPEVTGMSIQDTTKGLNVTIFCQVSGLPQPELSWQFKAKDASEFVSIPGSENKLHISNANEKHTGQYKCVAQNVLGRDEHVTSFIVKFAPEITTKEKIYKARVGDVALRIPCDTVGEPKPVIIWKAAGTEIKSNSHYSIVDGALLIKDPKESDSKSYVCEAQNALGSTQATFKAEVHSAPVATGMSTQVTTKDLNATIFCKVSGLPQPAISWQFKAKDASEFVSIPGSDNKLHISNANEKDTGQYKCVAQNVLGRAEHVTSFIVKFAPEITTKENICKALVGDVALRIPCDIVGEPKPVVIWKAAGTEIKPNAHYSIVDGALLIKDPKESDSKSYVCEAKNELGSTQATFKAEVDLNLEDYGTVKETHVLLETSKRLECGSDDPKQKVRWFKEGVELDINTKFINLDNLDLLKEGNYSCHMSDMNGARTLTFEVIVGYPPEFSFEQEGTQFDWDGSDNDYDLLDCQVVAKPPAKVVWTYNGKVLPTQHSLLSVDGNWGHYTCNVSNIHGAVQKTFDVISSKCLIKRKPAKSLTMPLILTQESTWPVLDSSEDYLKVPLGQTLKFYCPAYKDAKNHLQNIASVNEISATCDKQDTFKVDGKPHKVSDLNCAQEIDPIIDKENVKCLTDTSDLMRVGYDVHGFLEAYEVCFDTSENIPLYARVLMSKSNQGREVTSQLSWYRYPGIGSSRSDRHYTCVDATSSCCYSKTQLVNARDFSDGPAQRSTYIDPLNSVPYWRPCDTEKKDPWSHLENMIRSQFSEYPQFIAWSGTHTPQEKNGLTIPRYLWKVLRFDNDDSIAVVYVNDPKPSKEDVRCKNICVNENVPWIKDIDHHTYCCNVEEFLKAFGLQGTTIGGKYKGFYMKSMEGALAKINSKKFY